MSSDFKYGIILLAIGLGGYILTETYRHILPFVAEDEYYIYETVVDKNIRWGTIHSKNCPFEKSTWFTWKRNLYDIILKEDVYICNECFGEDEAKKILMLHNINLEMQYKRYQYDGFTADEIDSLVKRQRYNLNANLRDIYYLE